MLDLPALRRWHPMLAAMKLNAALSIVLLGVALRWSGSDRAASTRRTRVLALVVIAIAGATLVECTFGIELGIDELLHRDPTADRLPGQMAPVTAGCLVLLGVALAGREAWWAEWLALLVGLVAHLALLGYLYGVHDVYAIGRHGSVAVHTAVALYALAIGVLLARPQRGVMRFIASESPGGVLARRLLPAAMALPPVLGLLRQWGETAGLFGTAFGRALLVASTSVVFLALIWQTAAALARSDERRRGAEDEVRAREAVLALSNARLRVLAESSTTFAQVITSPQALLDQIARTSADLVGDGCTIMLLSADGEQLVMAASAHRDPAIERQDRALYGNATIARATSKAASAIVARTGQPQRADADPATIALASDDALKPRVALLKVHSYAAVAIRIRGEVIGTLVLLRSEPGRGYTDDDVTLLQDLADRAGLALDSARLYEQLEQRVHDRTAALEAANKELEAFSYSVAHDLRTPLRGIAGFSRTVVEDYADRLDAAGVQCLGRIEAGAQRMGQLIDDLLDLARASRAEVRRTRVDMSELAREVLARLQLSQPARDVELVLARDLVVNADARLLEIVLTNLLGNAWKFTGNRVHSRIELAARTDRGVTAYSIRDNGAGFPAEYVGKLFGVFERLHTAREFEGTGMGLAIAQRIIHRHGGKIWAEGALGQGATFSFTLEAPRAARTVPPSYG